MMIVIMLSIKIMKMTGSFAVSRSTVAVVGKWHPNKLPTVSFLFFFYSTKTTERERERKEDINNKMDRRKNK